MNIIGEYKTNDLYRAAFYFMHGCQISDIDFRRVAPNRAKKVGYRITYMITFEHVDRSLRDLWSVGLAEGNLKDYANARIRLKKFIRKYGHRNRKNDR